SALVRPALTNVVATSSRSSAPMAALSTASARSCVTTIVTAPSTTSDHTRREVPGGRRIRSAKSTPPTAIAWPESARPRRTTSANAAMPAIEPEREREERGRPDRDGGEEPRRLPERRRDDQQIDEVAARQRIEHTRRRRAARGRAIVDGAAEHQRRGAQRGGHRDPTDDQRPARARGAAPPDRDAAEDRD